MQLVSCDNVSFLLRVLLVAKVFGWWVLKGIIFYEIPCPIGKSFVAVRSCVNSLVQYFIGL